MKPLQAYRELVRGVRRLPLDVLTLERAKSELKRRFNDSKGPQSSLVRRWQATFEAILIRHEYGRIHEIFDELFKKRDRENMPEWLYQLRETDYLRLKPYWPQVELIKDIVGDSSLITKYSQNLDLQRPRDICVHEFLQLSDHPLSNIEKYELTPLKKELASKDDSKSFQSIVNESRVLFDFLLKHTSRLDISNKVPYFEMIYEPTTTGLPWSASYRDLRLKKHISNIKLLFDSNLPMKEQDLSRLSSITLDPNFTINPIFYKVMVRAREKAIQSPPNPLFSKYLELKQLVPSKRNMNHFYRLYLLRQYYIDNAGHYQVSWINNYYESDPKLLVPQKYVTLSVVVKNSAET